uniref:methyl-accepting chemotaxis protein n=1 Tax=Campylobacter cuniculorum TaxID=374106 RepID=UPI0023F34626
MTRTLGGKLILYIVTIFVVVIALVLGFNYNSTASEIRSLYRSIQQGVLDASYTTINITMNLEARQHLEAVAKEILSLDKNDVLSQRKILFETESLIKYPSMYIVYDDDGALIEENYEENKMQNQLSPHFTPPRELRQRFWYVETKNKRDLIVTPVYVSGSGKYEGQRLSTITYPLIKNGKFIGVLGVDLFVNDFQKRFENFERKELPSLQVYITDSSGKIFSHRNAAIVENQNPLPQEIKLKELLKNNKEGEFTYEDPEGNTRIGFYRQFPFGWTMVSGARLDDYTDAINEIFIMSLAVFLAVLIISAAVLFFIIKKMTAPIEQIKISLLGLFKYINHETSTAPAPLPIKANDELGQMATAINENIRQTKLGFEQDNSAVKESVETVGIVESGNLTARITANPRNPQLVELKNVLNRLLDALQSRVGSDMNIIHDIFEEYKHLDFRNKIENATGNVEVTTNALGEEII